MVALFHAGLVVVRQERVHPDLAALRAFAEAAPGRRAILLVEAAGHWEHPCGRAAISLLDAGENGG